MKVKNEKGSIALVLILIIISTSIVIILSRYIIAAQLLARKTNETQIKANFREDSIVEVVKNLVLQKTMDKSWEGDIQGKSVIGKEEIIRIEEIANQFIASEVDINSSVQVSLLKNIFVDNYCETTNDYPFEDEKERNNQTFRCFSSPFDIEIEINIKRKNSEQLYQVNLEDFYLQTIKNDETIVINKSKIHSYVK